jgi:hypothetical protein
MRLRNCSRVAAMRSIQRSEVAARYHRYRYLLFGRRRCSGDLEIGLSRITSVSVRYPILVYIEIAYDAHPVEKRMP